MLERMSKKLPSADHRVSPSPKHSVRVVVSQEGQLISEILARPENEVQSLADAGPPSCAARRLASRNVSDQKLVPTVPGSGSVPCLCFDTSRPFTVELYRHADCKKLESGFWHTECLNGRMRMGNAMDRTPPASGETAKSFPFEDISASNIKHSKSFHLAAPTSAPMTESKWIVCGSLIHKIESTDGFYKLRISPSLNHAKDDYVVEFRYQDKCSDICRALHRLPLPESSSQKEKTPFQKSTMPALPRRLTESSRTSSFSLSLATVYSHHNDRQRCADSRADDRAQKVSTPECGFHDAGSPLVTKRKLSSDSQLDTGSECSDDYFTEHRRPSPFKRTIPRSRASSPPLWFPDPCPSQTSSFSIPDSTSLA